MNATSIESQIKAPPAATPLWFNYSLKGFVRLLKYQADIMGKDISQQNSGYALLSKINASSVKKQLFLSSFFLKTEKTKPEET